LTGLHKFFGKTSSAVSQGQRILVFCDDFHFYSVRELVGLIPGIGNLVALFRAIYDGWTEIFTSIAVAARRWQRRDMNMTSRDVGPAHILRDVVCLGDFRPRPSEGFLTSIVWHRKGDVTLRRPES